MDKDNSAVSFDDIILSKQKDLSDQNVKLWGGLFAALLLCVAVYFSYGFFSAIDISPSAAVVDGVVPANEAVPTTAEDNDDARQQFKTMLSAFEVDVQPLLDSPELIGWDRKRVNAIANVKNQSLSHFSKSEYAESVMFLDNAKTEAATLIQDWNAAFTAKLNDAQAAFDANEINQALLSITQALKIKPSAANALELKQRISVYPEIQKLLNAVKIAKAENNPEKQIEFLEKILLLDSKQEQVALDLTQLKAQVTASKFQAYINDGLRLVSQGKLEQARATYNNAKSIYSDRPELKVLADKISQLQDNDSIADTHHRIANLKASDDWSAILALVNSAGNKYPNDEVIADHKKLAVTVLDLRNQAASYLSRPERLADQNVKAHALAFIRQASPSLIYSSGLAADIKAISDQIDSRAVTYPVTILSDGNTHITIVKTGIIGEVKTKTINLADGSYDVVGSRVGYKTKQLTLKVGSGLSNQLTMVCDERVR